MRSRRAAFYDKRPLVLNGDTPVQAVWNLQNTLSEHAHKAVEDRYEDALERKH